VNTRSRTAVTHAQAWFTRGAMAFTRGTEFSPILLVNIFISALLLAVNQSIPALAERIPALVRWLLALKYGLLADPCLLLAEENFYPFY